MNAMTLYWAIFIATFIIVFFIDLYVTDHRKGPVNLSSIIKTALVGQN